MESFGGLTAGKMMSIESEVREMSGVQQRRSLHEIISRDGLEASSRSARHTRQSLNGRKPHLIHSASSRVRMAVSDFSNIQELGFTRTSFLLFVSHWRSFPWHVAPAALLQPGAGNPMSMFTLLVVQQDQPDLAPCKPGSEFRQYTRTKASG
jgi:hypothetical protein